MAHQADDRWPPIANLVQAEGRGDEFQIPACSGLRSSAACVGHGLGPAPSFVFGAYSYDLYGPSLGARLSPSSGESGCLHIFGLLMGLLHMALALMESARLRLIR